MPKVTFHKGSASYTDEVPDGANLVVRAGIKQFPFPHLSYRCGMGTCATCACRILAGAEHLPEPNWKEQKQLGDKLAQGYRLACQLWLDHDLELLQDETPMRPARPAPTPDQDSDQTP